ncbi:dienelactone hydrolase family protein [Rhodopila sp.]|jgi:carboxymethylenebutenolidase|uniref:dienelactone hydrolase family protein n=1 Tax=Rhodopila sp. TaxID=2480087 RepID=UPI002D1D2D65|nr:dienelactone hydrolase family protein [Rhodopila sp.]HVZ07172.1 dienelactone hydrolase family protein [Rhodopila sp.]
MHDDMPAPFEQSRRFALTRRGFAALGVGAGAATASAVAAPAVTEADVTIRMADGTCDAALFHPAGQGPWPGCIIFPDALGLRPAFRDMGSRLAAEGYTVLVPNPFYRTRKAPVLSGPFNFANPDDRAKLVPLVAPLTTEAKTADAAAWLAWLETAPQVSRTAKLGVSGYCMGGPYTLIAAAAAPDRVGAGGSFHGAGLVTDKPDSPHLLAPRIKAAFYIAIAANDDQRQPDAKDKLREAFAGKPVAIEVYAGCMHGWCVSDGAVYNKDAADRAFGELAALYRKALAVG